MDVSPLDLSSLEGPPIYNPRITICPHHRNLPRLQINHNPRPNATTTSNNHPNRRPISTNAVRLPRGRYLDPARSLNPSVQADRQQLRQDAIRYNSNSTSHNHNGNGNDQITARPRPRPRPRSTPGNVETGRRNARQVLSRCLCPSFTSSSDTTDADRDTEASTTQRPNQNRSHNSPATTRQSPQSSRPIQLGTGTGTGRLVWFENERLWANYSGWPQAQAQAQEMPRLARPRSCCMVAYRYSSPPWDRDRSQVYSDVGLYEEPPPPYEAAVEPRQPSTGGSRWLSVARRVGVSTSE